MKKITSILLALVLVFSFAACSNNSDNSASTANSTTSTPAGKQSTDESSDNNTDSSSNSKILVVYYSATGSTKAVADTIADTTRADLFEITPVVPYTSDDLNWTNDNSRVSVEHNDESKRDVPLTKTTPDNWADYDTVFIGYPIWWGIAAWPVNNFVEGNDFTGKTVIPFCTSSSSGLGQSGDLLADMAGTGNWQDGERFSSGASSSKVESWVNGLDLK
ncbi:flavodoxin [Lachnospira pectinoschiza]|uniref:flavodoxin n=1 Tax=Lachnospira TaxID=28050 RepID=UPI001D098509|nr:flavodoxin [Lachnospira pectinoschiza]MCB6143141.1 flavodoxin [Lachnospira pectinoschiza]